MSTKNPIACGQDFYLYKECFSNEFVYLELENCEYKASNNRLKVKIPIVIWEFLRSADALSFEYANLTDSQIESLVADTVDDHIARRGTDSKRSLLPLFYGNSDGSREELILKGLDHLKRLRETELVAMKKVEDFKRKHEA